MDVKESEDGLTLTITSDKRINPILIYKSDDGFSMFKMRYEGSGTIPEELSGFYTSRQDALRALKFWLDHVAPTKAKEWEDKYKDVEVPVLKTKPIKREAE